MKTNVWIRLLSLLLAGLMLSGCGGATEQDQPTSAAASAVVPEEEAALKEAVVPQEEATLKEAAAPVELASRVPTQTAAPEAPAAVEKRKITGTGYTAYLGSLDKTWNEPVPLYFMDGVKDLPYVELESWVKLLSGLMHELREDAGYKLKTYAEDDFVLLERENNSTLELDFTNDLMIFDNYDGFIHTSKKTALIDLLSNSGFDDTGKASLFRRKTKDSYDRSGDLMIVDLGDYGIDLIAQDGKYYIPLQTMNDFLLSLPMQASFLYNGEALFYASDALFYDQDSKLNDYARRYYDAGKGKRSTALATYSYNEMCLVLDCFYGLKEPHEIERFHQYFWRIGYVDTLIGTNAWDSDIVLKNFIQYNLDDLHSAFSAYSHFAGIHSIQSLQGMSAGRMAAQKKEFASVREKYYPGGCPSYEEVGDTAYLTLDAFTYGGYSSEDYYRSKSSGQMPNDTIGVILYAHSRITRKGSPVKNVVLDLSNNTGGSVDAAIFTLGWILGSAQISIQNMWTGAMSTAVYETDTNLDREFNDKDNLSNKKVFCLVSPVTFSCGNTVAAALKSTQEVTILGRVSGGGSCIVQPLSTAHGSLFQISSAYRMSFLKNGSFYDVDQGVDPDHYLNTVEHYYDRRSLTKYINSLF